MIYNDILFKAIYIFVLYNLLINIAKRKINKNQKITNLSLNIFK